MKTIPYEKFKHGQRVKYCINGQIISSATIIKDKDTVCVSPYNIAICWDNVEYYEEKSSVKNLQFLPRTLDELEEGDVIVDEGGVEVKVLGVCGKVCFLSCYDDFNRAGGGCYTLDQIKKDGYTIKQEEEKLEFRESTEEEKKIVENPVLIINEDEKKLIYKGKTYIL